MRVRLAGTSLVAALLAASLPSASRADSHTVTAGKSTLSTPAPAAGAARSVKFGVYDPASAFAAAKGVGIEHVYVYWQQLDRRMVRERAAYAQARGRRLLITVEPYTHAADWRSGGHRLFADIVAGRFDRQIASVCAEVAASGDGTIVRWGHEMEQPVERYPWARKDAEGYKRAYRYFVERCRAVAPSAQFMWSPKGEANLAEYYPGEDWVHMVGLSVYGLQKWDHRFHGRDRTFAQVFGEKYMRVARFRKPVVIAEFGVAGSAEYRRAWLEDSARRLAKFPRLTAIVYFNAREPAAWPAGLGSPDWRVAPTAFLR